MSRSLDLALSEHSTMPSVGGDPVVESGSNSDGGWTRWADGTQSCVSHKHVDYSNSGYQTFSHPVAFFSNQTGASLSQYSFSVSTAVLDVFQGATMIASAAQWRVCFRDGTLPSSELYEVVMSAIGRWK